MEGIYIAIIGGIVILALLPNNRLKAHHQGEVLKVDEKRTTPLLNAKVSAFRWKAAFFMLLFSTILWFVVRNYEIVKLPEPTKVQIQRDTLPEDPDGIYE